MKKIILSFILVFSIGFSSCEKDDICDGSIPTTARMVVSFYDFNDPSTPKTVTNLKIIAEGMTEGISNKTYSTTILNEDKAYIPLKTDADLVRFSFILNFDNANPVLTNEDIIRFDYSREEIFISRACGFKTKFTLDEINPFTHDDGPLNDAKWIKAISVKNYIINNENETHLEIYF